MSIIKNITTSVRTHWRLVFSLLFFIASGIAITIFAAPPTNPYTQGETLDPTCTPGSTNCTVGILESRDEGTNLTYQTKTLDFVGAGVTSTESNGVITVTISGGISSAIGSLNGLTGTTQTFATGTAGTDFGISSSGTVHTFNVPSASASVRGLLTSTDWTTFNSKFDSPSGATSEYIRGNGSLATLDTSVVSENTNLYFTNLRARTAISLTSAGSSGSSSYSTSTGVLNIPTYTLAGLGGISLTGLSATSPLSYNNTTGVFSIDQSGGSTNGYLSSVDWTTFNNKQNALGYTPLNSANNLSDVSSTSTARTNLGLGTAATQNSGFFLQVSNNLSDLASAGTARTNLGLGSLAILSSVDNSNWSGTVLSVSNGGTGASTLTGILVGNGTSAFTASSNSSGLSSVISDETGSGSLVFNTDPTISSLSLTGTSPLSINQSVATTGSPTGLTFTGGAHTTLTASVETIDVNLNLARVVQFETGALTTQRAFVVQAPTYASVGASTITDAVTFAVTGAPVKGTNTSITSSHGILVQAGAVSTATAAYGLTVNAPTGATTNLAAQFMSNVTASGTETFYQVADFYRSGGSGSGVKIGYWSRTGSTDQGAAIMSRTTDALVLGGMSGSTPQRGLSVTYGANGPSVFVGNTSSPNSPYDLAMNGAFAFYAIPNTTKWSGLVTSGIYTSSNGPLIYGSTGVNGATFGDLVLSSRASATAHVGIVTGSTPAVRMKIDPTGNTTFTQGVATTGSPTGLTFTGGAHTTLATSTEATDVNFNLARTVQFGTGALTTQRAFRIQAPTYGFVAASTITDSATFAVSGAPVAGTNTTITGAHAILVSAGAVGSGTTASYGLTVNAQTGATTNYAAQFMGGNVGIGTATPTFPLEVTSTTSSNQTYGYLNSAGGTGTSSGVNSYSISATGRILASEFNAVSDARLKDVQFDLDSNKSLELITQLRPLSFTWKNNPTGQPVLGFLAQEVESVIPNAVSRIATSNFSDQRELSYNQLTAVAIGAIKALDLKITPLTDISTDTPQSLGSLMKQFLENASNTLEEVFFGKVHTKELCLDDICITKTQLQQLLQQQNIQSTPNTNGGGSDNSSGSGPTDGGTITGDVTLPTEGGVDGNDSTPPPTEEPVPPVDSGTPPPADVPTTTE